MKSRIFSEKNRHYPEESISDKQPTSKLSTLTASEKDMLSEVYPCSNYEKYRALVRKAKRKDPSCVAVLAAYAECEKLDKLLAWREDGKYEDIAEMAKRDSLPYVAATAATIIMQDCDAQTNHEVAAQTRHDCVRKAITSLYGQQQSQLKPQNIPPFPTTPFMNVR